MTLNRKARLNTDNPKHLRSQKEKVDVVAGLRFEPCPGNSQCPKDALLQKVNDMPDRQRGTSGKWLPQQPRPKTCYRGS